MTRTASFALFVALPFAASAQPVQPAPPTPPPATKTHQVYDVIRQGSKIGTDVIDTERQGDTTTVKMATNISVKILMVEVYRYQHQATEVWKAGQFVSFKSQTNDNGTKHTVTASAAPQKLALDVDGVHTDAAKSVVPATLWNSDLSKHVALFDPADGKRMSVAVADLGEETVTIHGVPHKTHHIKLTGDFPRDLWFDGDTLVRLQLTGSDSSIVTSDLQASSQ